MKTILVVAFALATVSRLDAQLIWTPVDSFNLQFRGMAMVDSQTCYAIGQRDSGGVSTTVILRTTDAGWTWNQAHIRKTRVEPTGSSAWFRIGAFNRDALIAVGYNGHGLRSTDAGATWDLIWFGLNALAQTIVCHPNGCGLILFLTSPTTVAVTSDYGETWTPRTIHGPPLASKAMMGAIQGRGRFIVPAWVDETYYLSESTDFGKTWTLSTTYAWMHVVQYVDSLHGWGVRTLVTNGSIVSDQMIYRTTDGGATWFLKHTFDDPSGAWPPMSFCDPSAGVVSGDTYIMRTSDSGETWTRDSIAAPPFGWVIAQCNAPGRGIAATRNGYLLRAVKASSAVDPTDEHPQSPIIAPNVVACNALTEIRVKEIERPSRIHLVDILGRSLPLSWTADDNVARLTLAPRAPGMLLLRIERRDGAIVTGRVVARD